MTHALTRSSLGAAAPARAARHLAWAVALVISGGAAQAQAPRAPGDNHATDPLAVPAMLHLAMVQSQAAEAGSAYHVDRHGHGANPRHGLALAFTPEGARIEGRDGGFDLRLERFGRGDGRPVLRAAPRIDGAWIEYDRGSGLTEWFVNLPRGVEQGWTLARRPAGGGALVLELDTARPPDRVGNPTSNSQPATHNSQLMWSGLVYHRLVTLDADGRELPAVWAHDGARLRIEVDDRDAAYPLLIDPWVEQDKLTAGDGIHGDEFGVSVALAGDTALVGADRADPDGNFNQGAAYVFTRSGETWSQQAKLTADDGAPEDVFGISVALAGDTALVGAIFADVDGSFNQGAAYVFTRSGGMWSQQDKLTADDGTFGDEFGGSVALAGDTALVGAVGNPFFDQGAAYVFTRSDGEWSQQAKLTAADGGVGDAFGGSVALAGDTALVGAVGQGAAYVFTRSDGVWSQQAKLTADDGAPEDDFGFSVAVAGDTALVGAIFADVDGSPFFDQGAAYVFTRSDGEWSQQAKLTADDGAPEDDFGFSVAVAGDTALVGAIFADVDGNINHGAAYVFTRSDDLWSQQDKFTADEGILGDKFGFSVALADGSALVGARDGFSIKGAAYVYAFESVVELAFDPPSLVFADVVVGTTSDPMTATLENTGDAEATGIAFINANPSFEADTSACGETLPAGESCDVLVTFTALVPGPAWGTLQVLTVEGASAELGLEGNVEPELVFAPSSHDFSDVQVGWISPPLTATLENTGDAEATGIAFTPPGNGFTADTISFCGETLPAGASCDVFVFFAPTVAGAATGSLIVESAEGATAELDLSGNGVDETEVFVPMALAADLEPLMSLSDGNLVFEPGERVEVAPTWVNGDDFPQFLAGTASGFTGPEGPTYNLAVDTADYGEVEAGAGASCLASGMCYQMDIGPSGVARPALHWDAAFDETLTDETAKTWTLHVGDSFLDVPRANLFYPSVETLLHHGVTGGCTDSEYCLTASNTRGQMAVFLLRALEGGGYTPPACVQDEERFLDVPFDSLFCPWIEELTAHGVTSGCGGDRYCPDDSVTRAQMAVFLLKSVEGEGYTPPECTGAFTDVPCPSAFAVWIEELARREITGGCGTEPPAYCPAAAVTRAQMAVFITRTFGLALYGP